MSKLINKDLEKHVTSPMFLEKFAEAKSLRMNDYEALEYATKKVEELMTGMAMELMSKRHKMEAFREALAEPTYIKAGGKDLNG